MLQNAGAKEVHVRISSPPITHPCFFGIDTPVISELIASSHTIKEIQKYIMARSLRYLSLEGLRKCVQGELMNSVTVVLPAITLSPSRRMGNPAASRYQS